MTYHKHKTKHKKPSRTIPTQTTQTLSLLLVLLHLLLLLYLLLKLITMTPIKNIFSVSCFSTIFVVVYIVIATLNLYRLMHPLAFQGDLTQFQRWVSPLWPKAAPLHLRVYVSTRPTFSVDFLQAEYYNEDDETAVGASDVALIWDELVDSPSFSKSFVITTCDHDRDCDRDDSFKFATTWLDQAEQTAIDRGEGSVLSLASGAGQGIESTSILLTFYQSISKHVRGLLAALSLLEPLQDTTTTNDRMVAELLRGRRTLQLPQESPIWTAVQNNSTLYAHVIALKADITSDWPPLDFGSAKREITLASRSHSMLSGSVQLVKFDPPSHIAPPSRILYKDVVYVFQKYLLGSAERPPWDMEYAKPNDYAAYQRTLDMRKQREGYPYWKPEVSIKYVNDQETYPIELVERSGMQLVQTNDRVKHPTGITFIPSIHVDEIGLTSEKYIPINATVTSLPLRISFDRSDMEHTVSSSTATAGGISPARWRLLSHLSQAIESQKELGFDQSDIDDLRRVIADTNVTLLAITMLASALHLLFEFLTFKSEVSFWKNNKDLTGLSVRSLFLDVMGQSVILIFLIEQGSSLLITIPSGIGCLIALWKCERAAGLRIMHVTDERRSLPIAYWNMLPRLLGYEIRALRLEAQASKIVNKEGNQTKKDNLQELTLDADRIATRTLGAVLFPLVAGYAIYSFVTQEYTSWFSWLVRTASSAVYALGFVLMTPQLFLNWKLKSVAHLPWRVLIYKSLNTFIDDLFSFIIRMPTLARISCFRDDVVFFVYIYQRWLYPVDKSRPVEGVNDTGDEDETVDEHETKKKQ
jgi:hypothetical protein